MTSLSAYLFDNGHPPTPTRTLRRLLLHVALVGVLGSLLACATQPRTLPTAAPTVPLPAALAQQNVYETVTVGASTQNPGFLIALNAQTGALRWQATAAGTIGVPVVGNGTVYMAADDGNVYAFDAVTGQQRWVYQRTIGVSDQTGYDGYVALAGQTLYVTSDGAVVFALDAANGHARWIFHLPLAKDHIYTAPAIAQGLVYVSSGSGLYALDDTNGTLRWKLEASGGFGGVPIVVNGTLYVGGQGFYTLYALDALTGKQFWSFQGQPIISRPAVGNGLVYIGATDQTLYALDAHTGDVVWKYATTGTAAQPLLPTGSAPTLAGKVLYVGGQGGELAALDALTGHILWHHELASAIDSPPTVADGVVFAASDQGMVYALRASDGASGWVYRAAGWIYASPAIG